MWMDADYGCYPSQNKYAHSLNFEISREWATGVATPFSFKNKTEKTFQSPDDEKDR